jgi:amino acid transporter
MSSEASNVAPVAAPPAPEQQSPARLQGNMGTLKLVFIVLAFNAPLGLMAAQVPLVIGFGPGLGAPTIFLILGALTALLAVGYTVMARMIPRPGALYAFVTAGLGRPAGLGASFLAMVVYTTGGLYAFVFVGLTLRTMVAQTFHGPELSWWIYTLLFAAVIAVLGYLRIDISARVVGVLLVLEMAALVVYDAVVLAKGGSTGHLSAPSFDLPGATGSGVAIGLVFAVIAFMGFETTAVFRDEVRDPERTVPRATYTAVGVLTLIYVIGCWLLIEGIGREAAVGTIAQAPDAAFFDNVHLMLGSVGNDIVNVLFVTSSFASLATLHNVVSRYLFNLGMDGVLPRSIGKPHHRHGSPHRASVVVSTVTIGFVGIAAALSVDPLVLFKNMAGTTGYGVLVLLTLVSVGIAAYLLRNRPEGVGLWRRAVAPLAAVAGMAVLLVLGTENLDLISGSRTLSVVAICVVLASLAFAVVVALGLRSSRPEVYERIGTDY